MTSRSLSPALQQQESRCKRQTRGHGHGLSRGRLEELCSSLKGETLPAAQGPGQGVPTALTSAALSARPGSPDGPNDAGPRKKLRWLWEGH